MAGFLPTLFERLFDDAPHREAESNPLKRWTVDELKESVAQDLESLLNSRAPLSREIFERFPESIHSIASYGMATSSAAASPTPQIAISSAARWSRPLRITSPGYVT